ncbi:unnamed protein product [Calypogeia fissa]
MPLFWTTPCVYIYTIAAILFIWQHMHTRVFPHAGHLHGLHSRLHYIIAPSQALVKHLLKLRQCQAKVQWKSPRMMGNRACNRGFGL